MEHAGMSGFRLQPDDRTEEERARCKATQKVDEPLAPMDTDYQEEVETNKDQIRFNMNFDKGIRGLPVSKEERNNRYDIRRLFEAAASGDAARLEGLHEYLVKTRKNLSDTLYRSGNTGKTALMKGLLNLKNGKNETVDILLNISEGMGDARVFVNVAYTGYYEGQTALHIAIERRSFDYVKLLVSKGADLHAKASGAFFQPQDGPSFYFGELPLSLAACTNQPDVVELLLKNGADATQTDSQGNTVLHALVVIADNTKENTDFITHVYDLILTITAQLHPELRLDDIENNNKLTPLKMAAKTGKIGVFSHILQREFKESHNKHLSRKFTEWVYGPVHSSLYDLATVDSYEDNSVLEILVYGSDIPNRHEMLEKEPLCHLLDEKWGKFAGGFFVFNFIIYTLYLVIFTTIAYNKKDGDPPFPIEHTTKGYLYVSGQLLILVSSLYFFFRGILDMKKKRPKLKTLLIDGYYEILFFLQAVLFLVSTALYLCGRQEYLGFLVLCLALSWVNLLYFSRGYRHMGIYSIMIQKMILSDILRFLFVYIVFLFGFSAAVVTLLIEPPPKNETVTKQSRFFIPEQKDDDKCVKPTFRNISYTLMELFKFTIGMGDMEFTEKYQYKEVFYVLLIGYIILTYILLLNMLIALMNRTVERITTESGSIWKLQRAITILDMERRLPHCLRKCYRCGEEKNLGRGDEEDRRYCFRVEEVNWNKWNQNLGIINEDPGYSDGHIPAAVDSPVKKRLWMSIGGTTRWRHQRAQSSTEMIPLRTPV
ncbi:transient receptor potential cation channel subfamily V member 1 [Genypterus blacodes]|uniref:transient receptor potential cation channel subfamily V member 1 n=1 Tax=Genypterus blacodes TaxID=154954 RepID=UPI003F76FF54